MNIYLAIITTVLVLTQIIRITQNYIQLRRQHKLLKAELKQLSEVTQDDLDVQKAVFRMLYAELTARHMNCCEQKGGDE